MNKKYLHLEGVFGDSNEAWKREKIQLDAIEAKTDLFNYEITEHLHSGLTQLFFMDTGNGRLLSDGNPYQFKAPCILFVPSGILHGFTFSKDISGEVLTLSTPLFENCLKGLPDLSLYFQEMRYLTFEENRSSFDELMGTRLRFHAELKVEKVAREKIIQLLLQILIVRLYRLVAEQASLEFPNNNRMLSYFQRFQNLLKSEENLWNVGDAADKLHISAGHLNRVCRELVNKPAHQLIQEQRLKDARRLLLTSEHSIAEIAYRLAFRDPSHFSKFFKRQEGTSPRQYRKKIISGNPGGSN